MSGKGDKVRPLSVSSDIFSTNWSLTFKKQDKPLHEPKIYVFDLDMTLVEGPDYYNCKAIPGRVEAVNKLYDEGNTIIVYTARGATTGVNWYKETVKLLTEIGLNYTELRMGKFNYDVWVDDKAVNDLEFFK